MFDVIATLIGRSSGDAIRKPYYKFKRTLDANPDPVAAQDANPDPVAAQVTVFFTREVQHILKLFRK